MKRKPSAAVYRRRRLVAGLVALLLIAALVAGGIAISSMFGARTTEGTGQGQGAGQSNADTAQNSDEKAMQSGPDAADEAGQARRKEETAQDRGCTESQLVLSASTDKTVYAPEQKPVLTLSVANESEEKCLVNLGTSEMGFLITSGEDRIFSSKDCQVEGQDNYQSLEPGKSETAKFTWNRTRTGPGCDQVNANPRPGTYVLVTKLGERTSGETIFRLN